jgi:hypothetical protein
MLASFHACTLGGARRVCRDSSRRSYYCVFLAFVDLRSGCLFIEDIQFRLFGLAALGRTAVRAVIVFGLPSSPGLNLERDKNVPFDIGGANPELPVHRKNSKHAVRFVKRARSHAPDGSRIKGSPHIAPYSSAPPPSFAHSDPASPARSSRDHEDHLLRRPLHSRARRPRRAVCPAGVHLLVPELVLEQRRNLERPAHLLVRSSHHSGAHTY